MNTETNTIYVAFNIAQINAVIKSIINYSKKHPKIKTQETVKIAAK